MGCMELIAKACYTACALTNIQEHKRAALMYVQRILPTHTALEHHVKSVVFQGGHVWGQTLASQLVLPSLVHGTRLIMDYMNHTGRISETYYSRLLVAAKKDAVAAASAKRLHVAMHCSQLV